jgi:hypothetical protein
MITMRYVFFQSIRCFGRPLCHPRSITASLRSLCMLYFLLVQTVQKRLTTFHAQTEPVTQFYEQFNKVKNIQAVGTIDEVWARVKAVFEFLPNP